MAKISKADIEQAKAYLLDTGIKEGDTVYCLLKSVARSGMSRTIQLIYIANNEPHYIGYNASKVVGERWDSDKGGIVIRGCGMDMGFALVCDLSYRLFGKEGKLTSRWL